jgi:hypothetical protein
MSAVTYSDDRVKSYLQKLFVPVRHHCDFEHPSQEMLRYAVKWTPTLLVLDAEGGEHHRCVGYAAPQEFTSQLNLGLAKMDFARDRLSPAIDQFAQVVEECPSCIAAPEARYFLGVSRFKQSHDAQELKRTWQELSRDFPQSEWAKKAEPYSRIE